MGSDNSWKVICTGKIKANFTEEMVIANIKQAFQFTSKKAKTLIQGSPVLAKKGLKYHVALQYQRVLEAAGVEAKLEKELSKYNLDGLSIMPLEGDASHDYVDDMNKVTCPSCYMHQPKAAKCIACGHDIVKHSQNKKATMEEQPQNLFYHQAQPASAKANYIKEEPELEQEEPIKEPIQFKKEDDIKVQPKLAKEGDVNDDARNKETFVDKLIGNKKHLFILVILLVVITLFFFNRQSYQEIGNSADALAQIKMLNKSLSHPSPDAKQLRKLLQTQKYNQLESILSELSENVTYDITWEGIFRNAIVAISERDKVTLKMLNNWVNSKGSVFSYLARGSFYVNEGVAARGAKYVSQTSKAQFSVMKKLYLLAYADLIKAKSIDNSLIPIYALLIMINVGDETSDPRIDFLNEAISVNPAGSQYRYMYMYYLKPKWGGSWEEMKDFASDSSQYLALNPRLNLLFGYIPAEKGNIALKNKNLDDCIHYYSEALQYGIQGEWLRHRAYCLYDNGDYELALKDINLFFAKFNEASDYDRKLKRYLIKKVN